MENFKLDNLNPAELISIEGGSLAYDIGHFAGSVTLGIIVALVCKRII